MKSMSYFYECTRGIEDLGCEIVMAVGVGWGTSAKMFHPPKMPQRQRNGNGTGFQRVPVENPLNTDVAPVADPFFQPLLAVVYRCWFNGRC